MPRIQPKLDALDDSLNQLRWYRRHFVGHKPIQICAGLLASLRDKLFPPMFHVAPVVFQNPVNVFDVQAKHPRERITVCKQM